MYVEPVFILFYVLNKQLTTSEIIPVRVDVSFGRNYPEICGVSDNGELCDYLGLYIVRFNATNSVCMYTVRFNVVS